MTTVGSKRLPKPTILTLRTVPLLAELPDSELALLVPVCHWRQYRPGAVIARQNEAAERIFFVVTGAIKVQRGEVRRSRGEAKPPSLAEIPELRSKSRPRSTVGILGPGEIVGELGVLLGRPRTASLVALATSQVLSLPGEHFVGRLLSHAPFSLALNQLLARRLVATNQQVELMSCSVEDRVRALFRQCHALGIDIEHSLTNAEIARMIGASRVAVSKLLNGVSKGRHNHPNLG